MAKLNFFNLLVFCLVSGLNGMMQELQFQGQRTHSSMTNASASVTPETPNPMSKQCSEISQIVRRFQASQQGPQRITRGMATRDLEIGQVDPVKVFNELDSRVNSLIQFLQTPQAAGGAGIDVKDLLQEVSLTTNLPHVSHADYQAFQQRVEQLKSLAAQQGIGSAEVHSAVQEVIGIMPLLEKVVTQAINLNPEAIGTCAQVVNQIKNPTVRKVAAGTGILGAVALLITIAVKTL